MGYAHYTLPDGREAGYGVTATCDEDGCEANIDRGMAYLCGENPGTTEHGCGRYFCGEHLFIGGPWRGVSLCRECLDSPEFGECIREDCGLPTVDDDTCWWCRNADAGTYLAAPPA